LIHPRWESFIGGSIVAAFCLARNPKGDRSRLFELARLLVRLNHVARFIGNANHSIV
jgi:hypothetical protein